MLSLVLPAAPMYVNGDAGRLRQVVTNLVENAAKYTEPGGRITVTLEQHDDEAVLRVRDNGIGIASGESGANLRAVHAITPTAGTPLQRIGNRAQRRAANTGTARWSHHGHQRRSRRGKRIRCLAAGGAGRHAGRPGVREPRETAGSARDAARAESHDRRRSRRDQEVGRPSGPQLGSRGRRRQRRPECALACGGLPARLRHRGPLIAGDERD